MAADWKGFSAAMAAQLSGRDRSRHLLRSVDLWRFLMCEPLSLRAFARAFNGEVQRQSGDESSEKILLGYSMGGRLALHCLLDQPDLWDRAIIVSAHTGLLLDEERVKRRAADAEWAARALKGDWDSFLSDWNTQGVLSSEGGMMGHEGFADRHSLKLRRESLSRSFMDWSLGLQEDLRSELSQLDIPVQWVVGERDEKFRMIAEAFVPMWPAAKDHLAIVKGAGHRVPWEQPEAFQALVTDFLKEGK